MKILSNRFLDAVTIIFVLYSAYTTLFTIDGARMGYFGAQILAFVLPTLDLLLPLSALIFFLLRVMSKENEKSSSEFFSSLIVLGGVLAFFIYIAILPIYTSVSVDLTLCTLILLLYTRRILLYPIKSKVDIALDVQTSFYTILIAFGFSLVFHSIFLFIPQYASTFNYIYSSGVLLRIPDGYIFALMFYLYTLLIIPIGYIVRRESKKSIPRIP